ncbi:hypothetical protein A2159_01680 [Candidatus Woesebacteria bacterium RBG_13_34_9]|uniref:Glycosyltransferase RgtA/B/C/D-like domain-containing protein n=1 Tax=Candidatus Woesebacteria bacterium RBG_13_34_9 TaxID=1802477 RepID=A0A1F7WZ85_9BACT|nr:MAG: hypothetical protein A2159_01680 [Candidatus Woesebacteria bacterium RBG_13_34_9]
MKNKFTQIVILGIIIVISTFLYSYKLEVIPNGFYVDEAAVAYNAYSILLTGKDIFGQSYPILFRLLGSYTPPLFIYISVLFFKLFGMGIFTLRIISVMSAVTCVIFFYLIVRNLGIFKMEKSYLITTFFFAISPWLFFNARLGYEVTLAFLLFNVGVYFLLLAFDEPKNYIWSMIFLSLSTYTAHTQRFLTPIFIAFYLLVFVKDIFKKQNIRYLIISSVVTLLIQIPHFMVINTPAFWVKNERLIESGNGSIIKDVFNQAISYLSTKNLFYQLSDIDIQHTIPEISVMYNWMVIPFLVGLFFLFYKLKERKFRFLILLFFVSLIPAILSGKFISIQRALPFMLPLVIVIGLGMDQFFLRFNRIINIVFVFLLSFYSLILLYRSYFILFPIERAEGWNYGYSDAAEFIYNNPKKHFLVDNNRNPRNYILLLYYLRYPPIDYQLELNPKYKSDYYLSLPTEDSYRFSNIEVRAIDWKTDSCKDQVIIGDPLSISESQAKEHFLDQVYEIFSPKKERILVFYKTNPKIKCKLSLNSF